MLERKFVLVSRISTSTRQHEVPRPRGAFAPACLCALHDPRLHLRGGHICRLGVHSRDGQPCPYINLHSLYTTIILGGKRVENQVGVLVHANQVARLQLVRVDQADERKEDGLPGRGLNDSRLSYSCSVKIDVGTFF